MIPVRNSMDEIWPSPTARRAELRRRRGSVCSIALLLVCLESRSDSFSYCTHLPFDSKVATLPFFESVADRYIPHVASTLYHTCKGSVRKLSGRPNWPLMIL